MKKSRIRDYSGLVKRGLTRIACRVRATKLTVVSNEIGAEMVCGLLRSNGIHCGHRKSDFAQAIGEGPSMAGPTEVFVAEEDLKAARRVLAQK